MSLYAIGSRLATDRICPVMPKEAEQPIAQINGYVLAGVIVLFTVALLVGIGSVIAGKVFSMPHASKGGVVTLAVVFVAAIALLILPGMKDAILGDGCIG